MIYKMQHHGREAPAPTAGNTKTWEVTAIPTQKIGRQSACLAFVALNPAEQADFLAALAEVWEAALGTPVTAAALRTGAPYPAHDALPPPLQAAQGLLDTLNTERFLTGVCGVGATPEDAAAACHAAQLRLTPPVADTERSRLALLLLALPETEKRRFVQDFGRGEMHTQDPETLRTAREFLYRQLSPARASAALYIHRNTLQYRLARLEAETGINLNRAEDAAGFWVWDALRAHMAADRRE